MTAQVEMSCSVDECTEDASAVVRVDVIPTTLVNGPSTCGFVKEQLDRQDAAITVTNTGTRTIAIAAVLYRESDLRNRARGPCEGENLFPGETLSECIDRAVGGCDHALSGPTIGFSSFLLPGETSLAVPYVCRQEFIYIPPGSDGSCGEGLLETVTENWIVQAVYCDNSAGFEASFCKQVDLTMKTSGRPSDNWGHVERSGCP